jgi:hypothetical protein
MSSHLKIRSMQQAEEGKKADVLPVGLPTTTEQWLLAVASLALTSNAFASDSTRIDARVLPVLLGASYVFLSTVLVWIVWRTSGGDDRRLGSAVKEYGSALVGILLFALGSLIRAYSVGGDALIQIAHISYLIGVLLMVSVPVRVWFRSPPPLGIPQLLSQIPLLGALASIAATVMLSVVPSDAVSVVHGALLAGVMLLMLRRTRTAPGALTVLMVAYALILAISGIAAPWIGIPALVTGACADVAAKHLFPLQLKRRSVRCFSVLMPIIFSAGAAIVTKKFAVLPLEWYLLPGLAGWLTGFLVLPPREFDEE